jgi:hypothetical protein
MSPDIRKRSLTSIPRNDLNLSTVLLKRLASWGIVTVDDLTKVGAFVEWAMPPEIPRSDADWRGYKPALMDIRGLGMVRLNKIRCFLREHDLKIADEDVLSQHRPMAC